MSGKRQSANQIAMAIRRQRVCELRQTAMSVRAIAAQIVAEGLAPANYSYVTASRDWRAEYERLLDKSSETAEQTRALELERLDVMLHAVWHKIESGDARAIDTALRVAERRAKLLGLDAPVRTDITVTEIDNAIERELARVAGAGKTADAEEAA